MSEEHNGDIKRFLRFLKECYEEKTSNIENICEENDTSFLYNNELDEKSISSKILEDIDFSLSKINSYSIEDGNHDYKSGFFAGLQFTTEIFENILNKYDDII